MTDELDDRINAGLVAPGEYAPAGEAGREATTFTAEQLAAAFAVASERVHRALAGEFSLTPADRVDSQQAQHLTEVILGDLPLDQREAALMRLGAFTPRVDHDWGIGEAAPGEESDRVIAASPEIARARHAREHDPDKTTG
jgi:hypothetical protein